MNPILRPFYRQLLQLSGEPGPLWLPAEIRWAICDMYQWVYIAHNYSGGLVWSDIAKFRDYYMFPVLRYVRDIRCGRIRNPCNRVVVFNDMCKKYDNVLDYYTCPEMQRSMENDARVIGKIAIGEYARIVARITFTWVWIKNHSPERSEHILGLHRLVVFWMEETGKKDYYCLRSDIHSMFAE